MTENERVRQKWSMDEKAAREEREKQVNKTHQIVLESSKGEEGMIYLVVSITGKEGGQEGRRDYLLTLITGGKG